MFARNRKALTKVEVVIIILLIISLTISGATLYMTIQLEPVSPPEEKEFISIGASISATGWASSYSLHNLQGYEFWVEDVNSRGGIYVEEYGRKLPVKFFYYDDRSAMERVTLIYERLITEHKVDIVFAPMGSSLTLAAAAITEKHKVPIVIANAASTSIYEQGFNYIFSASQQSARYYPIAQVELAKSLGVNTAAIIHEDTAFGISTAGYVREQVGEQGLEEVLFESMGGPETMDYTALIGKLRAADADAIWVIALTEQLGTFVKQMKELNLNADFIYAMEPGLNLPAWTNVVGDDGLYFFTATGWSLKIAYDVNVGYATDEFAEKMLEAYPGVALDNQHGCAYSTAVILEKIIEEAGSLDPDKIMETAHELSGTLVSLFGNCEIMSNGEQRGMDYAQCQVIKDSVSGEIGLEILFPPEVATGEPIFPIPKWDER